MQLAQARKCPLHVLLGIHSFIYPIWSSSEQRSGLAIVYGGRPAFVRSSFYTVIILSLKWQASSELSLSEDFTYSYADERIIVKRNWTELFHVAMAIMYRLKKSSENELN